MPEKNYENVKGSDGHGLELLFRTFCSRMNWNHYNIFGESECHPYIMEESMVIRIDLKTVHFRSYSFGKINYCMFSNDSEKTHCHI